MGNMPNYRAIVSVGEKKWDEIGAGWVKGQNVSIRLKVVPPLRNGKMDSLLVPARKRAAAETDTTEAVAAQA